MLFYKEKVNGNSTIRNLLCMRVQIMGMHKWLGLQPHMKLKIWNLKVYLLHTIATISANLLRVQTQIHTMGHASRSSKVYDNDVEKINR